MTLLKQTESWQILLSLVGDTTYKRIRTMTSPDTPSSSAYKDVLELVQKHYRPKP